MQSNEPSPVYSRVNQLPCDFDGCGRRQVAKGLCAPHYKQRASGVELKPVRLRVNKGRACTLPGCGRPHRALGYCAPHFKQLKAGNGFGPVVIRRPRSDYRNVVCDFPECDGKAFRKGMCRSHQSVRHNHSLSTEQIVALFSGDPSCGICGGKESSRGARLHIDHDHICCPGAGTCGKCVRGLLCSRCNTGIGHLRDSPAILRSAIKYLETYHGTDAT